MNLIESFQNLMAQVPELLQPLIVALAGAVPFIEGEGGAIIGIIGGIHPVIAAVAAAAGNFLCVLVVVLIAARARRAVTTRVRARQYAGGELEAEVDAGSTAVEADTPRKQKFLKALEKYGVPGVSLLGPLILPTQFTAAFLTAAGVRAPRVLFWQAIAIAAWTTLVTLIITGVVRAIFGG